jgi:hypothetical protein
VATLKELLIFTGAIKPDTHNAMIAAFDYANELKWRTNSDNEPHGHPWHESFHASSFPGNDDMACPRKAMYTLMDFAKDAPDPPRLTAFGAMGKAMELAIVNAMARHGSLISTDQNEEKGGIQTGFTEPQHWLTGNADALQLPEGSLSPVPIEIKVKRHNKWQEIKQGLTPPPPENVRQAKAYLAGMHLHLPETLPTILICEQTWTVATGVTHGVCRRHGCWTCLKEVQLAPIQRGALMYLSFDEPDIKQAKVFPLEVDLDFYYDGLAKLTLWRQYFENNHLPSLAPTSNGNRAQPHGGLAGWGWSKDPCRFCNFKKVCKQDHIDSIQTLTESAGVRHTQEVRAPVGMKYDPEKTRQAVFDRWPENKEEKVAA